MKKKHVVVAGDIEYKMSSQKFKVWGCIVLAILVLAMIHA